MVGHKFLSVVVAASTLSFVISILGVPNAWAEGTECTASSIKLGGCSKTAEVVKDVEVVLKVDVTKPDAHTGDPRVGGSDSNSGSNGKAAKPTDPAPPLPYLGRDGYTFTGPLTLSDIARFRPDAGTDLMQPNGWMIVGLSTNFYARAAQQVKSGTLLGQPASVRFTPARYAWTYGDGAARTTSAPGATWATLGINEFDATPTSHIYRAPGKYFIDLTIGYTPEYRYASGTEWIPITGMVWMPANRLEAEASAGAKTVLVEDECTINPAGPGC